ncbi:hypothetical protein B0D71_05735 [Pseudomonas laurylsulfativorans]|uniref:Uncharacterized protein n=1 Tax=Pseudomonas laurylsulfativorans TaxID=1943631 RepID=A0A2S3VWH7_9PSED|nr:hypothetical protein [Pseudomonas laurylsulfativorans]POF44287.1 hypothetical protein B0D71_05735 [Pseudomonas laurylsulfativorans]
MLVLLKRDNEALIQQLTTKQQHAHQLDKQLRAVTQQHDQLRVHLEQQQGTKRLLSTQLSKAQRTLQWRTLRCQYLGLTSTGRLHW